MGTHTVREEREVGNVQEPRVTLTTTGVQPKEDAQIIAKALKLPGLVRILLASQFGLVRGAHVALGANLELPLAIPPTQRHI